jgi:hypothetical protein
VLRRLLWVVWEVDRLGMAGCRMSLLGLVGLLLVVLGRFKVVPAAEMGIKRCERDFFVWKKGKCFVFVDLKQKKKAFGECYSFFSKKIAFWNFQEFVIALEKRHSSQRFFFAFCGC